MQTGTLTQQFAFQLPEHSTPLHHIDLSVGAERKIESVNTRGLNLTE